MPALASPREVTTSQRCDLCKEYIGGGKGLGHRSIMCTKPFQDPGEAREAVSQVVDGYLGIDEQSVLGDVMEGYMLITLYDCMLRDTKGHTSQGVYLLKKTLAEIPLEVFLQDLDWDVDEGDMQQYITQLHAEHIWDIPSLLETQDTESLIRLGIHPSAAERLFETLYHEMGKSITDIDIPLFHVPVPGGTGQQCLPVMHVRKEHVPKCLYFNERRALQMTHNGSHPYSIPTHVEDRAKKAETLRLELMKDEEARESSKERQKERKKTSKSSDLAEAKIRARRAEAFRLIQKKDEENKRTRRIEDKKARQNRSGPSPNDSDDPDTANREREAEAARAELLREELEREQAEKSKNEKAKKKQKQRETRAAVKEEEKQKEELLKKQEEEERRRAETALQNYKAKMRNDAERVKRDETKKREAKFGMEEEARKKIEAKYFYEIKRVLAERKAVLDQIIKGEREARAELARAESKMRDGFDDYSKQLSENRKSLEKTTADEPLRRVKLEEDEAKRFTDIKNSHAKGKREIAKKIEEQQALAAEREKEKEAEKEAEVAQLPPSPLPSPAVTEPRDIDPKYEENKKKWQALMKSQNSDDSHGHASYLSKQRLFPHIQIKQDFTQSTPGIFKHLKGSVEDLRKYIDSNDTNVNVRDPTDWTPLMTAAHVGNVAVAKFLIEKGADVNAKNSAKETALMTACVLGHTATVRTLKDNGAALNSRCAAGGTAMFCAAQHGFTETLKVLLDAGVPVNQKSPSHWTALMIACYNNNISATKLLLEYNADVHNVSEAGWTALMCACKVGSIPCCELLYSQGASLKVKNYSSEAPIMLAAKAGNASLITWLADRGADPDATNDDKWTPLLFASKNGQREAVKALIQAKASIDFQNIKGWSAITAASFHGKSEAVQLLVDNGANVTIASEGGWTPLMFAAKVGAASVCRVLLQKYSLADVNSVNHKGWTAVMIAAKGEHDAIVKLLIATKADLNTANCYGWTPLFAAAQAGCFNIVKNLVEAGANVNVTSYKNESIIAACTKGGHLSTVQYLHEHGAELDGKDEGGWTALMAGCKSGKTEIVRYLLESGANPNIESLTGGWTAMKLAATNKHQEIVGLLRGAKQQQQQQQPSPPPTTQPAAPAQKVKEIPPASCPLSFFGTSTSSQKEDPAPQPVTEKCMEFFYTGACKRVGCTKQHVTMQGRQAIHDNLEDIWTVDGIKREDLLSLKTEVKGNTVAEMVLDNMILQQKRFCEQQKEQMKIIRAALGSSPSPPDQIPVSSFSQLKEDPAEFETFDSLGVVGDIPLATSALFSDDLWGNGVPTLPADPCGEHTDDFERQFAEGKQAEPAPAFFDFDFVKDDDSSGQQNGLCFPGF